jgi:hypothetical protein
MRQELLKINEWNVDAREGVLIRAKLTKNGGVQAIQPSLAPLLFFKIQGVALVA